MIIELEINGARVIISGDNLTVNVSDEIGSTNHRKALNAINFDNRAEGVVIPSPCQIKNLRKSLGLSQAKFAKQLAVTQATVCRWETGKMYPDGPAAIVIASMMAGAS